MAIMGSIPHETGTPLFLKNDKIVFLKQYMAKVALRAGLLIDSAMICPLSDGRVSSDEFACYIFYMRLFVLILGGKSLFSCSFSWFGRKMTSLVLVFLHVCIGNS